MSDRIRCRTTVALPHLPVGSFVIVDPEDPYMAGLLEGEVLVPEPITEEG